MSIACKKKKEKRKEGIALVKGHEAVLSFLFYMIHDSESRKSLKNTGRTKTRKNSMERVLLKTLDMRTHPGRKNKPLMVSDFPQQMGRTNRISHSRQCSVQIRLASITSTLPHRSRPSCLKAKKFPCRECVCVCARVSHFLHFASSTSLVNITSE